MTKVTRLAAATEVGRLVNCWVVDVGDGLVTVDSSLLRSDALAHRAAIEAMGKPVVAALVTHGHPDHVVGLDALLDGIDVPVYGVPGVAEVMRTYEPVYEGRAKELPEHERVGSWKYPDVELADGQVLDFADASLRVQDIGNGGDCRANSVFWLEAAADAAGVFTADLALRAHPWLFDGGLLSWLANLDRLAADIQAVGRVYPGHLDATDASVLTDQRDYLLRYAGEVKELADGTGALTAEAVRELERRMIASYPQLPLRELIAAGATAVAAQL